MSRTHRLLLPGLLPCLLLTLAAANSLSAAWARHSSSHRVHHGVSRAFVRRRSHELRAKLQQTHQHAESTRARLRVLIQRDVALSEQIHQDELAEQDAALRLMQGQQRLKELNDALRASLLRLHAALRRLAVDRATLKLRLRDVYEQGNIGVLNVLLNSNSVVDFMNRREYASRVVRRDVALVRRVHDDEQEIARESRILAAQRTAKEEQVREIQAQADRLNQAIAHRSAVLAATDQEIESARQAVAEMESQSSSVQQMLYRLQQMPILTVQDVHGRTLHYHLHWAGRFIVPANGPITSPFGYRYHPILHVYKLHTGVDIGAGYGAVVHAAASGVVVHASWLGAYGNGIIIDHGDGLATLYGHLSRIDVAVGQGVGQGQPIGLVGSTGLSTGPHLHFEVRKYGTPVPPF